MSLLLEGKEKKDTVIKQVTTKYLCHILGDWKGILANKKSQQMIGESSLTLTFSQIICYSIAALASFRCTGMLLSLPFIDMLKKRSTLRSVPTSTKSETIYIAVATLVNYVTNFRDILDCHKLNPTTSFDYQQGKLG